MNGQEPLQGEALHVGSPITEGYIQQENKDGDKNYLSHICQMYN